MNRFLSRSPRQIAPGVKMKKRSLLTRCHSHARLRGQTPPWMPSVGTRATPSSPQWQNYRDASFERKKEPEHRTSEAPLVFPDFSLSGIHSSLELILGLTLPRGLTGAYSISTNIHCFPHIMHYTRCCGTTRRKMYLALSFKGLKCTGRERQ